MLLDAIKKLQEELNAGGAEPKLKVDGIAGDRTLAELRRQQAVVKPAPVISTAGKVTTRAAAIKRYGAIDLDQGTWADKSKWLKKFEVPDGWFPDWKVGEHTVKNIWCNSDTHAPLMAALKEIHEKGLGRVLKTFDGCFNIRVVRGSSAMSTHAYGLGFDINAKLNPLAGSHGDFTKHMDVVDCFRRQGFDWGGDWNGRKDQMHFSYAWE